MRLPRLSPLHRAAVLAALLVVLLAALPMLSPDPPRAEASGMAGTRPSTASPLTPGYVLAIVLVAGGGLWALHLRRRQAGPEGAELQTLGQLALGPQGHLRLVRCGDEVLLLGVTGHQVTLLRTYDVAPGPATPPAADARPNPTAPPPFAELLRTAGLGGARATA